MIHAPAATTVSRSFLRIPAFTQALGCIVALLAALVLPVSALAQGAGGDSPVKVRVVPRHDKVAQGGQLVVAIEMDMGTEYHAWPAKSVQLPPNVDEFAIRTELSLPKDKDDKPVFPTWIARFDGVQYPVAKVGKAPDPSGEKPTIEVPLYAGKAAFFARLNVKPDATAGEQTINLRLAFQVCNDEMCLQPEDLELPVKVTVLPKGQTDLGPEKDAKLFEKFDASLWGKDASAVNAPVASEPKPADAKPTPLAPGATTPRNTDRGPTNGASAASASIFGFDIGSNIFVLAFFAMIGGAVLNLTPCVLPVIPIKVMALTQHATSRSHAIILGLWMAIGVVAFWTVIGIPMAFISAKLDPSQFIFGNWWLCLGIGLIVAVLGLGIMGLFTFNLPQAVYSVETEADSPFGSFMYGVFAAILGLPCFGFVAGGLLAAAATLPWYSIMTIFVGLGVGMAAPYLVLSIWPNLLKFIPRTGPASDLVKQVMGILLFAAAAFFITAAIQALLKTYPFLSGSMVWWTVGFFVALAMLWMLIRTWQITKKPVPRAVFSIIAIVLTAGVYVFAHDAFTSDRENYKSLIAAQTSVKPGEVPTGVWVDFTPENFELARKAGQPIFLDFTADWCITCKALKRGLLDKDPLRSKFKDCGIVLMEVDCTVKTSPGSKFLQDLGRTGVPTWVIYAPGSDLPHFVPVDKPTSGTVLTALEAAGVKCDNTGLTTASSGLPATQTSGR